MLSWPKKKLSYSYMKKAAIYHDFFQTYEFSYFKLAKKNIFPKWRWIMHFVGPMVIPQVEPAKLMVIFGKPKYITYL